MALHRLDRAPRGLAPGMLRAVEQSRHLVAGQRSRVAPPLLEAGEGDAAHPFDVRGAEGGVQGHVGEQVQRRLQGVRQAVEVEPDAIQARADPEGRSQILQLLRQLLTRSRPGPLVERAGDEIGQAGPVGRVPIDAGADRQLDHDHGHRVVLSQQNGEPVRQRALDRDRRAERRDGGERGRLGGPPGVRRRRRGGGHGWLDRLARGAPQREQEQAEGGRATAAHGRAPGAAAEAGSTSRTTIRSAGKQRPGPLVDLRGGDLPVPCSRPSEGSRGHRSRRCRR
jgi:hypothetical protein